VFQMERFMALYPGLEIYNGYLKAVSKNAIDGKDFSYGLAGDIR